MKVVIAVDAGGTKTKIVALAKVADEVKIISELGVFGCGSPAVLGTAAMDNILSYLNETFANLPKDLEPQCIALGVSGLGVIANPEQYQKKFEQVFNCPVVLANDAVMALYSIVTDQCDEGILVLAGTGSSVLGVKDKQVSLFGGWGHLLGEAGSGYAVVHRAVLQTIAHFEAHQTLTPFQEKFLAHLQLQDIYGFKNFIYNNSKAEVAHEVMFIRNQADVGDSEAESIIIYEANRLAQDVINLIKAHHYHPNVLIGYRGSYLVHTPLAQQAMYQAYQAAGLKPNVVITETDPIYGGYYMAKRRGLC